MEYELFHIRMEYSVLNILCLKIIMILKLWNGIEIPPDKTSLDLNLNLINGICLPGFAKNEVKIILKYYNQYIEETYTEIEKLFMKAGYSI